MPLDKILVNKNGTAASWQAEDKRPLRRWVKRFNAFYAWTLMTCLMREGGAGHEPII
jgi:hypothetical protein